MMLRQVLVWNSVLSIFVLFLVSGLSRAGDKDSAVYYGNVQSYLQQGQLHMHMRVRSIATINQKTLTDYAAMGIGAGLSYVSPYFHQFQFGFSGFFTFNVFSWNLSTTDTQTGIPNRYEIMLFDGTDPENRHDLDRMEELYMKFTPGKWEFVVGRQYIETPWPTSKITGCALICLKGCGSVFSKTSMQRLLWHGLPGLHPGLL